MIIKILIVFVTLLAMSETGYAYIDPASGSLAVQMVIAIVVGGLFALKQFWAKIVKSIQGFFRKNTIKKDADTNVSKEQ